MQTFEKLTIKLRTCLQKKLYRFSLNKDVDIILSNGVTYHEEQQLTLK